MLFRIFFFLTKKMIVDNMWAWCAIISGGGNKPGEVRYSYEKSGVIAKIFLVLVVKYNRKLSNRTRENPECILEGLSQLGGAVSSLGGRVPVALLRNVTCYGEPRKERSSQSWNQQAGKKTYSDYSHPGLQFNFIPPLFNAQCRCNCSQFLFVLLFFSLFSFLFFYIIPFKLIPREY